MNTLEMQERIEFLEAELLKRDAAAGEPVAFTHRSEIENMKATGLYIRGFPTDRRLNAEEGYTVGLFTAAPPAPSAPEIGYDPAQSGSESTVITHYQAPSGWKMVPVKPTEDMVIAGFESEPDQSFSASDDWDAYEAMSGCQQAAHRAKLCWAAMLAAVPSPGGDQC